jgi:hypothetical protein
MGSDAVTVMMRSFPRGRASYVHPRLRPTITRAVFTRSVAYCAVAIWLTAQVSTSTGPSAIFAPSLAFATSTTSRDGCSSRYAVKLGVPLPCTTMMVFSPSPRASTPPTTFTGRSARADNGATATSSGRTAARRGARKRPIPIKCSFVIAR